jgi:hypothetical protein
MNEEFMTGQRRERILRYFDQKVDNYTNLVVDKDEQLRERRRQSREAASERWVAQVERERVPDSRSFISFTAREPLPPPPAAASPHPDGS